jgi:hypothetical protein
MTREIPHIKHGGRNCVSCVYVASFDRSEEMTAISSLKVTPLKHVSSLLRVPAAAGSKTRFGAICLTRAPGNSLLACVWTVSSTACIFTNADDIDTSISDEIVALPELTDMFGERNKQWLARPLLKRQSRHSWFRQ